MINDEKDTKRYKKFDTSKCWPRNTDEKKLPGECWKPVPYFEDTHEVSNYGRIRSLSRMIYSKNKTPYWRKGRVMLCNVHGVANHYCKDFSYEVSVNIESEGKQMGFSVRRLVYNCFVRAVKIPGGNNAAELVVPKDGNGMNTHYKNLILLTKKQKEQLKYDKGRTESALKYMSAEKRAQAVEMASAKRLKVISQYDTKGNRIETFRSITDASLKTGIATSTIGNAVKGRLHTAGGFVWRYGKGIKKIKLGNSLNQKSEDYISKVSTPITQYDFNGKRMDVYKSISEAARQTGVPKASIKSCLHGRMQTAKGFIWKTGYGKNKIRVQFNSNSIGIQAMPVVQYSLNKKEIMQYPSILDASKKTGISYYKIKIAASSLNKNAGGFFWKKMQL